MGKILRNEFVKLHSEPLLENLQQSFSERYPHSKFPDVPERGTFDLEQVKDSPYFFA
jgi:DNA-directed RNA polymerase